ncbi:hypothetical protein FKM82_011331 [Ascaphus truei]
MLIGAAWEGYCLTRASRPESSKGSCCFTDSVSGEGYSRRLFTGEEPQRCSDQIQCHQAGEERGSLQALSLSSRA